LLEDNRALIRHENIQIRCQLLLIVQNEFQINPIQVYLNRNELFLLLDFVKSVQRKTRNYFHLEFYFITVFVDSGGDGSNAHISAFKSRSPKLSWTYGIPFSIRNIIISSLTSRTKKQNRI
jgi:hypothetical protein